MNGKPRTMWRVRVEGLDREFSVGPCAESNEAAESWMHAHLREIPGFPVVMQVDSENGSQKFRVLLHYQFVYGSIPETPTFGPHSTMTVMDDTKARG